MEAKTPTATTAQVAVGRQNLGQQMPVFAYRMMQYNLRDELRARFGKEMMVDIFRSAGRRAGQQFAAQQLDLTLPHDAFLAQLQSKLEEVKLGLLQLEEADDDLTQCVLTIREDVDCAGLPITGETVCNYDEGFLAAILEAYTKKSYVVIETDCWTTGARACRFQCSRQDGAK